MECMFIFSSLKPFLDRNKMKLTIVSGGDTIFSCGESMAEDAVLMSAANSLGGEVTIAQKGRSLFIKHHSVKSKAEDRYTILMVTARREDIDKIRGMGLGADDYIEKTFSPGVLVARIKANLAQYQRLSGPKRNPSEITIGQIKINTDTHRVFVADNEVNLKNKEYSYMVFHERLTRKGLMGLFLITAGTLIMLIP